jgi:hypothetical protein
MVATQWLGRAAIIAGLLAFSATAAQALTLNVTSGGLEAGNANYGCPTGAGTCTLAQRNYSLTSDFPAVGTININDAGTILTINLAIGGATFDTSPAGSPISFAAGGYQATLTNFSANPTAILFGFGTGSAYGTANGNAFAVSPSVSISCSFPGGVGQCGVSFGESGFTNVEGHDWLHTFNLTVELPEPTTGLLIGLGLVGLALRARSR